MPKFCYSGTFIVDKTAGCANGTGTTPGQAAATRVPGAYPSVLRQGLSGRCHRK